VLQGVKLILYPSLHTLQKTKNDKAHPKMGLLLLKVFYARGFNLLKELLRLDDINLNSGIIVMRHAHVVSRIDEGVLKRL